MTPETPNQVRLGIKKWTAQGSNLGWRGPAPSLQPLCPVCSGRLGSSPGWRRAAISGEDRGTAVPGPTSNRAVIYLLGGQPGAQPQEQTLLAAAGGTGGWLETPSLLSEQVGHH